MTKENKRYAVHNDIHVSINDILFIKNRLRICDVVRVKDIYLSFAFEDYKLYVESIETKDQFHITFNEIIGHVIIEKGVDIYEYFKRK